MGRIDGVVGGPIKGTFAAGRLALASRRNVSTIRLIFETQVLGLQFIPA
jgi:hypothetical protein